jgi:hypothetical protein
MTEQPNPLEAELAAIKPRKMSPSLSEQLEAHMATSAMPRRSDRFLLSAISAGALAACVILAVLLSEITPSPAVPSAAIVPSQSPTIRDYQLALARADAPWKTP